jgi:tetratricopeptide (TPR) repeat protein
MCSAFGREPEYWEALPVLLTACRRAHLEREALQIIELSRAATDDAGRAVWLMLERSELLVDLGRIEEAEALLQQLHQQVQEPDMRHRLVTVQARTTAARGDPAGAIELCRDVAIRASSEQTRAAALLFMGRLYEAGKQFEKAAFAYAGRCPVEAERGGP